MTPDEIRLKLTTVFRDVFDDAALEISEGTTASDIPGWDSLSHVHLVFATEKAFAVSFTTKQVKALSSVGDLVRLIEARVK